MKILVDTRYSRYLPECTTLDSEIERLFGRRVLALTKSNGILRGLMAWWVGRRFDFIVTVNHHPGSSLLIVLAGLSHRRKLILLEFMIYGDRTVKRLSLPVIIPLLLGPALRKAMVAAQVMLESEPKYYAELLGIPESRFSPILLPLVDSQKTELTNTRQKNLVFSSGRAACDWETLLSAAEGTDWELVIVCGRRELKYIEKLNHTVKAKVLSDISADEHAKWMRSAAVYVLSLYDRPISSGQLRLGNAISCGTPTVATRVRGLEGYAANGRNALLVEPGNAMDLRKRVDELLLHPERRFALAKRARKLSESRTESTFFHSIRTFVFGAAHKSDTPDERVQQ